MGSLLAWLILGERMSLARILALLMAFAGIAALMGGNGIDASMERLPGILMVLVGASCLRSAPSRRSGCRSRCR